MNKYIFVLHHSTSELFLRKIQELGLVDISRETRAIDEHSKEMHDFLLRYKAAFRFLSSFKPQIEDQGEAKSAPCIAMNVEEAPLEVDTQLLLIEIEDAIARREAITGRKSSLRKEIETASAWGAFHRSDKDKILALGYSLHAYSIAEKRFDPSWAEHFPLFELNREKGIVYFVVLQEQGAPFEFPVPETKFPDQDIHALQEELANLDREMQQIEQQLHAHMHCASIFEKQMEWLKSELDRYLAGKSVQKEAEEHLDILTGFAPKSNSAEIHEFLEGASTIYLMQEATEEDRPPIKLKNNWFARLYEPIGSLYMLPRYGELDLTPYFAPFYMLFFGLCLGDMGYGLLLLIAGFVAKKKIPAMRGYASLVQWLGIGAILMASLSGVFFGMELSSSPIIPQAVKNAFMTSIQMFWFAILFGIFHIIFARLTAAFDAMSRKGWKYGMNNIGWAFFILWCTLAYASSEVPSLSIPFIPSMIWLGVSLVLIVGFAKLSGSILGRILSGTVSLYDITGVFGDVLSYIRLFGLGTAGGILGMVVNSVASSMMGIPYVGWLFAVCMLLVGHLAVMLLSCLGAFVHPMRLTFVEFYKNAGFTGGGREFKPLTKN